MGFQERQAAGRQLGRRSFATEISAEQRRHDAVEPHRLVERARLFALVDNRRGDVVLQVLADAGQRYFHGDAVGAQFVRIADARQHQKLRRVDDAAAQDDFFPGVRGDVLAVLDIVDAGGALAVERDFRHQRAGFDGEVVSRQSRPQISVGCAATAAVFHRHLPGAETFLLGAVVIGRRLIAGGASGGGEGIDQRIGKPRHLRRQRPVAAAIKTGAAFPRFLAPEIRQHMRIGPAGKPGRRPAVVIAGVPARIGHGIDRGRAADDAAARAFEPAAAGRRLGLGEILPVMLALGQHPHPGDRDLDPRIAVPAAGFEEQHARALILGQPVRQRAAGGTGADDDDVVALAVRHDATRLRKTVARRQPACPRQKGS